MSNIPQITPSKTAFGTLNTINPIIISRVDINTKITWIPIICLKLPPWYLALYNISLGINLLTKSFIFSLSTKIKKAHILPIKNATIPSPVVIAPVFIKSWFNIDITLPAILFPSPTSINPI